MSISRLCYIVKVSNAVVVRINKFNDIFVNVIKQCYENIVFRLRIVLLLVFRARRPGIRAGLSHYATGPNRCLNVQSGPTNTLL